MTERTGTYVYFAQAVTGGNIKIGYSARPMKRLEQLMEWSPERLFLLAFAPGGQKEEGAIHMHFMKHWRHHEWFYPAPELLKFVARIAERPIIPTDELPKVAPYKKHPFRKQVGFRVSAVVESPAAQ